MAKLMAMPELAATRVVVRVPATTANMGPGYDSLGMAVDLWNELEVEVASRFSMIIEGEGADVLPRDGTNLVVRGIMTALEFAGKISTDQMDMLPAVSIVCRNGIPFGSGLGSSSAGVVSGLMAGLVLSGKTLRVEEKEELLQLAGKLEGHTDNVAPCIYGGMQLGYSVYGTWTTARVPLPAEMQCVIFTPDTPMATSEARALLKPQVSRDDAIFNVSRTALLILALTTGRTEQLPLATQDRLHQPARATLLPALTPVLEAATAAGARGAFLSGAGSSIMALTFGAKGEVVVQDDAERCDKQVAEAMRQAGATHGVSGRLFISAPTMVGARVVSSDASPIATETPLNVRYKSTRDVSNTEVGFEHVVMTGLAPDGGLFVPTAIPQVSNEQLAAWRSLTFPELATEVLSLYVCPTEIPRPALAALLHRSYATFSNRHVTPLVELSEADDIALLEQFHGPTCAFKDVALQFVGNLFEYFLQRRNATLSAEEDPHTITIMGATSGDTGSAAIAGLRGKKNVEVFILHPKGRVAPVQAAQMTTVLDANVHNVAVSGAFDDCQTIVKSCFNDPTFRARHHLAAVNSINWARILAQIVYYFYAYFRWLDLKPSARTIGDEVTFCVPTGNFGNALAGFYAREMGLPAQRLVVATNVNDILHRFFSSSDYTSRSVVPSLAPAMDIVIPSNFERYLYHLTGNDPAAVTEHMRKIKATGVLDLGADLHAKTAAVFASAKATDDDIRAIIAHYKAQHRYVVCPHTAAGLHAARLLRPQLGSIIAFATAHPGKFGDATAAQDDPKDADLPPAVPPQLKGILDRKTRCASLPNDLAAVQKFVDATLGAKNECESGPASTATPSPAAWAGVAVASFAVGVAATIALGKRTGLL
eukprot:m.89395 g.89395  ORF g.89395 m.89395 type:complete len:879 (+) comp14972_c1_seq2:155-2791(+)